MAKKIKEKKTVEELLDEALVAEHEQPYKIPSNWVWSKFKSVGKLKNGYAFKSEDYKNVGIPLVRISEISLGVIDLSGAVKIPSHLSKDDFIIVKDDLLIAMSGATTGKIGIYNYSEEALQNQRVGNIKIKSDKVLSKQFRNFFFCKSTEEILEKSYGAAQPNISSNMIENLSFPLPPLQEQQRIVEKLEIMIGKIKQSKELIQESKDTFKTRRASILAKAFSGELTSKWREENNKLFNWEKTIFTDLCILQRGFDLPSQDRKEGVYPIVSSSGIKDYHSEFKVIGPGVTVGRSGSIGKVFYVEENKFWPLNTTLYVKNFNNNNPRYVYYYLLNFNFVKYSASTAVPTLNRNNFSNVETIIPPLEEQEEIVRIVEKLLKTEDEALEYVESMEEHLETLEKSILSKAFRGELGTNNPDEESSLNLLKEILSEN